MDTKELERKKELSRIIKDAQKELAQLNHADYVARAPEVLYVRWGIILDGESSCGKDRIFTEDIRYVKYNLAARLYELFELTAGIACSCASTGPDDTIEKEIDELLDKARWLDELDKGGRA